MASLKTLLGGGTISKNVLSFYVYGTSLGDQSGFCCRVCIPPNYNTAVVEVWGGGANGGGACCCQWPYSAPSPGSYVYSHFTVVPGNCYRLCAAGSYNCATTCCGCTGIASYVFLENTSTTCACAHGGLAGCQLCFFKNSSCYGICIASEAYSDTNIGCISVCGTRGASLTGACLSDAHEWAPGTPKLGQNTRIGSTHCQTQWTRSGCDKLRNSWPGGTGNGGSSCGGGCCWSGWGSGGLIIMTLYQ
jgi:hypothetical protein